MNSQLAARAAGILFVIADIAGVGGKILVGRADEAAIVTGAVLIFVMALTVSMIPVTLFPVLRKQNEALALSYVVLRLIEALLLTASAVAPLLLLTLRRLAVGTAEPGRQLMIGTLSKDDYWAAPFSQMAWGLSVAVLLYLLYRSHAVPRFITVWGLIGAPLYLASQLLVLYAVPAPFTTLTTIVTAQFAVNELVLIIWLLARGLRPARDPELRPVAV